MTIYYSPFDEKTRASLEKRRAKIAKMSAEEIAGIRAAAIAAAESGDVERGVELLNQISTNAVHRVLPSKRKATDKPKTQATRGATMKKMICILPLAFLLLGCASIKINDSIEGVVAQNWATIGKEYRDYVASDATLPDAVYAARLAYADKFDALLAAPTDELRLDKARAAMMSVHWVPISAIYEGYVEGDAALSADGRKIRKRSADVITYLFSKACAD